MSTPKTIDEQLERMRQFAARLRDLCQGELMKPESILVEIQIAADLGVAQRLFALADVAIDCGHLEEDKQRALDHGEALIKQWQEHGALQWLDGPRAEAAFVHYSTAKH